MALRLSEVVVNSNEVQSKILNAPIVAPDGKKIGVVTDIYYARDLTVKKVVVKNDRGLSFVVSAERLVLKDGVIVLQESPQAGILRAVRETCKALIELLEAFEEDDPQEGAPSLSAAREHLKSALKALDTGESAG
ncbi:MAG: hypothetical protein LM590_09270 [Thermofilum sp.]|jgi:hypothetical protein|nr:hypothetical protein [Thermofilum sp.]